MTERPDRMEEKVREMPNQEMKPMKGFDIDGDELVRQRSAAPDPPSTPGPDAAIGWFDPGWYVWRHLDESRSEYLHSTGEWKHSTYPHETGYYATKELAEAAIKLAQPSTPEPDQTIVEVLGILNEAICSEIDGDYKWHERAIAAHAKLAALNAQPLPPGTPNEELARRIAKTARQKLAFIIPGMILSGTMHDNVEREIKEAALAALAAPVPSTKLELTPEQWKEAMESDEFEQ